MMYRVVQKKFTLGEVSLPSNAVVLGYMNVGRRMDEAEISYYVNLEYDRVIITYLEQLEEERGHGH